MNIFTPVISVKIRMTEKRYIFESAINSFHYLYQDAYYLLSNAKLKHIKGTFKEVRLARSAFLLFILSIEGLVNRALDHFLPSTLHDFVLEKEDKFSTIDKWRMLALLSGAHEKDLDFGVYPWSHLNELIKVRNDYVHPKHDRMAYYEYTSPQQFKHLQWNKIPKGMKIKEKDVVYGQTKTPKDPYGFKVEHLEKVQKVVDDVVNEMDKILGGKLTEKNWARGDQMTLCYPLGAKIDDLAKKS